MAGYTDTLKYRLMDATFDIGFSLQFLAELDSMISRGLCRGN